MNKIDKNRLFVSHLKVHIPHLEGTKMNMKIVLNEGKISLWTKKFEAKLNVSKIDINQQFEIEEKEFISSIKFEIYEVKDSISKLLFRGLIDIENKRNILKDDFSIHNICYLTNSNGENSLSLYYNIEINQNIFDVYDSKLKNLQEEKKSSSSPRSGIDYFKELAHPDSAEVFTKFIKNIGYLNTAYKELIKFFTWKNPWKTLSLAIILTVCLIYLKTFFVLLPWMIIGFHVIHRRNLYQYVLNSTNNDYLENTAFIKMNVGEYNKLVNIYENSIHDISNADSKTVEKVYYNLIKLSILNLLLLFFHIKINLIILILIWIVLLSNNDTFKAFSFFFCHFLNTHLIQKSFKINQLTFDIINKIKRSIPFLDQYEEYLLKKNNPDLDFVQISKIDDVSVNNVDKNLLADKQETQFNIPTSTIINDTILKFEVLENERWWLLAGWTKTMILNERPPFSDVTGSKPLNIDSVFLPSDNSFEWKDSWKVMVNGSTDDNGWVYGNDFKSALYTKNTSSSYVRTRKWVRYAIKKIA